MKSRFVLLVLVLAVCLGMPAHAQTGQIVVINNAALKKAQTLNVQVYRMQGKTQKMLKNEMIVASEDCANGCGGAPMALDAAPGDYKIQVFGGVALETDAVTFPLRASDQFVWMVSNTENKPHIRAHAPGVKLVENKSPYRIDLVTYTKGASLNIQPAPQPKEPVRKSFWPFRPSNAPRGVNE